MAPKYDLEKIKAGVDKKIWERGVGLYEQGKITEFEESHVGYTAAVLGSEPYDTAVSDRSCLQGDCSCFMGRTGVVCKHVVALAIYAVKRGAAPKRKP